jgi:hypothetical protein
MLRRMLQDLRISRDLRAKIERGGGAFLRLSACSAFEQSVWTR